jgi:3-methyladenine DNA glycosylase AlkD
LLNIEPGFYSGIGPDDSPGTLTIMGSVDDRVQEVRDRIAGLADPEVAAQLSRFFKTGPGEYGEGDLFVGVRAPDLNRLAKEMKGLDLATIARLLASEVHEERMVALKILVVGYRSADPDGRRGLARFYLDNLDGVNNWDLVDVSAPWLLGGELVAERLSPTAKRLASSPDLWRRRVAMVSTLGPVRHGVVDPAIDMAELLLDDREDLIQKALGWVLREVGKRDPGALTRFLDANGARMGRTALRYSIERLPEPRRRHYLESTRKA